MKKIFSFIILTLLFSLFIVTSDANAQTVEKVYIHYHRFEGDYDGWNIHIWEKEPGNRPGKDFTFNGEDEYGKYVEINLSDMNAYDPDNPPTKIGFIIKHGSGWEGEREPGGDRLFNLTTVNELGEVHIYVIEGNIEFYTDRNDADISPQVRKTFFEDFKNIYFNTTHPLSDTTDFVNKVQVLVGDTPVEIESANLNPDKKSGSIVLKDNIDLTNDYFLDILEFTKDKYIEKVGVYDSQVFKDLYTYTGDDLGATYTSDYTEFRVWAPTASTMELILYDTGNYQNGFILDDTLPTDLKGTYPMEASDKGTWYVKINEDLESVYYTYKVTIGNMVHETVDPYAKAVGVNGQRGMVIDLENTDPDNWTEEKPELLQPEDSIIYEMHIRDFSIHSRGNFMEENEGKYLAFTETGNTYTDRRSDVTVKTGVDHLVELGITHLHLLPSFDYRSIDETDSEDKFNWGYDPLNYNAPEGTYATDPYNGDVRVNEYKQMVQSLHDNDIRVVMDVVYNHLGDAANSSFEKLVPGYYFRLTNTGSYSNGSGVGNETASERAMMRKFIVDSVKYWAEEYNIDGFRFDLMALHDIETMNQVRTVLDEIDPSIIVYGEGWTGGTSTLPFEQQADRQNVSHMPGIAVFNDKFRDGVKGSVWTDQYRDQGYVQNDTSDIANVRFGIVGGITHPQTGDGWANDPEQIVNYVEAHDNWTLFDKLQISQAGVDEDILILQDKQAAALIFTSQGIPFIQAGQDFLRTKPDPTESLGVQHNSYKSPDRVNQIRWDHKAQHIDVFNYYKGLIELRKAHPAFRMTEADDIRNNLEFLDTDRSIIAYTISNNANGDEWKQILVAFNSSEDEKTFELDEAATLVIVVDRDQAGTEEIRTVTGKEITLRPHESIVGYLEPLEDAKDTNWTLIGIVVGIATLGIASATFVIVRRNR